MNVASCLFYCPSGGKRDSYIPLRICPYLHSPRSREDRRFDTTKNQKTGQEKVDISSPHGFDKALEWTLCLAFTHCPPRGDRRQQTIVRCQRQKPKPTGQAEWECSTSRRFFLQGQALRVASQALTAHTFPHELTLPHGRKTRFWSGELSGDQWRSC